MPSITIIDTIPKFVSVEEHKSLVSTTPASFSDIPPVLRHQENDVKITLDPPIEGFSQNDSEKGTLYVIESVLVFISSSAPGRGIQIEYPSITLHAISRAENAPSSIYCQLDEASSNANGHQDDDEFTEMKEMHIIPTSPSSLEAIFEALSLCASLHPDPNMNDDMDDDDEAFISADTPFDTFNGDEGQELSEVGRAALEHLESIIDYGNHKPSTNDGDETTTVEGDKDDKTTTADS